MRLDLTINFIYVTPLRARDLPEAIDAAMTLAIKHRTTVKLEFNDKLHTVSYHDLVAQTKQLKLP